MSLLSYHASQEQFSPAELLQYVQLAAEAGFSGIHSSDHFHPWSIRQGQSAFTFSWISAAMMQCSLPFSMVCAPGQRLHPAIVAQAIATLGTMFPGRLTVELGSGEALNECITGDPWPSKNLRNERLLQCKHVISRLLQGEKVNFSGLITVKNARLFTLPEIIPPLFCAALSKPTAAWAGTWADGLLTTVDKTAEQTASKIAAFRQQKGSNAPVHLQFCFCYDRTKTEAIRQAHDQWRSTMVGSKKLAELSQPEEYDQLTEDITANQVAANIPIITEIEELKDRINELKTLRASCIHLHNISRHQEYFLQQATKLFT